MSNTAFTPGPAEMAGSAGHPVQPPHPSAPPAHQPPGQRQLSYMLTVTGKQPQELHDPAEVARAATDYLRNAQVGDHLSVVVMGFREILPPEHAPASAASSESTTPS